MHNFFYVIPKWAHHLNIVFQMSVGSERKEGRSFKGVAQ